MAVYVDPLVDYGWRLGPSCHMFADSVEELVEFAVKKVGMKRAWIQVSRKGLTHFDLTGTRRDKAVKAGAIELDWSGAGHKLRQLYEQGKSKGQRAAKVEDTAGDEDLRA